MRMLSELHEQVQLAHEQYGVANNNSGNGLNTLTTRSPISECDHSEELDFFEANSMFLCHQLKNANKASVCIALQDS